MQNRLIITCMKNEGPFILEWIAYHRSIGFNQFLVYTNDCDDGTDRMLETLQDHGIVQTMDNPYLSMPGETKPQKGALTHAQTTPIAEAADWVLISDVDEFVNIHAGDGTLDALFEATGNADAISLQWRLFGNGDLAGFEDRWITEQFELCAPEFCPAPIQAWAVKTLFRASGPRPAGYYKTFGVHRPLEPGRGAMANTSWVNGSGAPVLEEFRESGWRFGTHSYGYGLVSLNHYAVRSAESFVIKRDRGRVNHVERDQGLAYWLRMNFNMERDRSIHRHLPRARAELAHLLGLRGVKTRHADSVKAHRAKIKTLLAQAEPRAFYDQITSPRLALISRHLNLLDREMFNTGPSAIPEAVFEQIENIPVLMPE